MINSPFESRLSLEPYTVRPDQRIVTKLPIQELWDDTGTFTSERIRYLDKSNLAELLRTSLVRFVVANCGLKLRWVPTPQRFEFWKTVRFQIAEPEKPIFLKQFPSETAYLASEWRGRGGECVILLEMIH